MECPKHPPLAFYSMIFQKRTPLFARGATFAEMGKVAMEFAKNPLVYVASVIENNR